MKKKLSKDTKSYLLNITLSKRMKLATLLSFILFSFLIPIKGYAQGEKINLSLKNSTLKEALKLIEQQTAYVFFYNESEIDVNQKVTVRIANGNIEQTLNTLLTTYQYKIDNRKIAILPGSKTEGKGKAISGTVIDDTGLPVIGANIVVKGTQNGTITDMDGNFSLTVPANTTLKISYIGYVDQYISVGNQAILSIKLKEDSQALEEVVVVGYGTQKKVNLTGSVSSVTSERLENRPITTVADGLQGAMAGVTVTKNNGAPGSTSTIQIRGFSSLNSGGALVIVDGVPGDMNTISPDDVETISVLKDAASSSIYGARAAEGVILITTKKGKSSEKIRVRYSNNFSFQTPTILPTPNGAYGGAIYANLAFTNAGGSPLYPDWMMKEFQNPNSVAIPRADQSDYDYVADFNWWDYFLNNSFQQSQNISISGGSERNQFMLSGSWLDQNGYFSEWGPDNFDRITIRTNLTNQIIPKKLILETNLSMVNSDKDSPSVGHASVLGSIVQSGNSLPLYNPDGTYARYRMQQNTLQLLKEAGYEKNKLNRFEGRTALTWNVIEGLSLKALGGYNVEWNDNTNWKRSYYKYKPSGPSNLGHVNQPNSLTNKSSYYSYYIAQFQVNYNKTFGKHTLGALAGTSVEESFFKATSTTRSNILGNELPALNLGEANTAKNTYEVKDDWGLVSAFARVNYDFDNRYLLEANLRTDGSSRFSNKHKWGVFPSVSAGWRISEEAFMENQRVFSNLKLRGSYGELGNQNGLGLYDHIAIYTVDNTLIPFPGGNEQQIYSPSLPSQERTWETITSYNIGVDMTFLNDRLRVEAEYFEKKNKDMLINIELPSIIGISVPTNNYGEMKTKGWEVTLKWNDKIESIGLKYNVGFNLFDQTDELTNLKGSFTKPKAGVQNLQGYPINSIFAYQADGYFQSEEEVKGWAFQNAKTGVGDIRYVDQNGDEKITEHDVVYVGSTTPRFVYGFDIGAEWKGFDLALSFQGVGKRNVYLPTDYTHPYQNAWDNYSFVELMDYWTPDNRNADFPRPHQGGHNYLYSTHWLQDAAYIRLKNLQIGYSLPKALLNQVKVESLRVFFSGENLWEHTNLILFDPETKGDAKDATKSNGTDASASVYPLNRAFSFGLSLTF